MLPVQRETETRAPIYRCEGRLSERRAAPRSSRLDEAPARRGVTGGAEMKVNHRIAFYMHNPPLHISLSIAIKAPPSA